MSVRTQNRPRPSMREAWHLRLANLGDADGVYGLACGPLVYRYLFDATVPGRDSIEQGIACAHHDALDTGLGLWILICPRVPYRGCVQLRPGMKTKSAELICLRNPAQWRRGLATRMAWTAISKAFAQAIELIVAGSDCPTRLPWRSCGASVCATSWRTPPLGTWR